MSELKYGVNVENLLYDLSQHESDDIGEFDFYCEDEHGREGSATIDITLLASDALKLIAELNAQRDALAAEKNWWKPEYCPVTSRPFFLWIVHPSGGMVPTYGGPYDSYTIPTVDSDGEFCCERYDHDEGAWVDAESLSVRLTDDREPALDDAYLNSVRADVIKQLHSEQKEWALHTWQYDNFDALKRAAVRHGDSELSGVIFMLDRIEGFAAQLRAGEPS